MLWEGHVARNYEQPVGAMRGSELTARLKNGHQTYGCKELNSTNSHMNLEEDPELEKGMQSGWHIDGGLVRP